MNKTRLLSSQQRLITFSASHIATAIYTTDDLVIEAATDAMLNFRIKTDPDWPLAGGGTSRAI